MTQRIVTTCDVCGVVESVGERDPSYMARIYVQVGSRIVAEGHVCKPCTEEKAPAIFRNAFGGLTPKEDTKP